MYKALYESKIPMTSIPSDIDERLDRLTKEFDAILADPNTLKEAEEFHRAVSTLTAEDYFKQFTI